MLRYMHVIFSLQIQLWKPIIHEVSIFSSPFICRYNFQILAILAMPHKGLVATHTQNTFCNPSNTASHNMRILLSTALSLWKMVAIRLVFDVSTHMFVLADDMIVIFIVACCQIISAHRKIPGYISKCTGWHGAYHVNSTFCGPFWNWNRILFGQSFWLEYHFCADIAIAQCHGFQKPSAKVYNSLAGHCFMVEWRGDASDMPRMCGYLSIPQCKVMARCHIYLWLKMAIIYLLLILWAFQAQKSH